jgi:hypothetical protein
MVGAMEVADANIGRDAVYAADGGAPRVTYVWSPAGRRKSPASARRGSGPRVPA